MKKKTILKTLLVISAFLLGLSGSVWATGTYEDGDGSEGDPFQINTPAQMDEIGQHSEDWDSYFILTANIDLGGYTGTSFNTIGITLPFAVYTGLTSTIAFVIGPVGWLTAGFWGGCVVLGRDGGCKLKRKEKIK
jgi:hypothetical protein